MSLSALLLHLRSVKEGSNDRGRADSDGDSRLHQLGPALLILLVEFVVTVAHHRISMAFGAGLEAA